MAQEHLARRLAVLEERVADYVTEDVARWHAVHARITAYEIAIEVMCNVAQRRDPALVRDIIEGLAFVERETRSINFHGALIGEIRDIRQKLQEQLHDLREDELQEAR